jgi:hypothetical protein
MMPGNDEGRPPQGAPAHIEALRPTEPSTGTSISPASGIPLRLPRGPKAHKALAKQLGILNNKAGELIVLEYGNDPFYMGTPGEKRHAEWFAGLLEQYGLQLGAHNRRVHYRHLSTPGSTRPDGRPYENTTTCSQLLGDASRAARIFGLVDPESMVDRRNNGAIENVAPCIRLSEPEIKPGSASFYLPTLESADIDSVFGSLSAPYAAGYDYSASDQPVMIEVWCEKSTMNDVLAPLCEIEHLNYVEGTGYESITQSITFLRRAQQYGKAAHIIYVSDFDPGGVAMPVAVARQLQLWREELGIDVEVSVDTAVLTHEQCVKYKLPRTPIKETDVRRGKFEVRYGEGATELDALEALYPGELAKIIRQRIAPYRDRTLQGRLSRARSEVQQRLDNAWRDAGGSELAKQMEALAEQANEIAAEQAERIRQIMEETEERLQEFDDKADELDEQARKISSNLDVELPERPQRRSPAPTAMCCSTVAGIGSTSSLCSRHARTATATAVTRDQYRPRSFPGAHPPRRVD